MAENEKRYWLYVLKLEHDKYYVGITGKKNPEARIKMHGGFFGARWTKLHKPLETIELQDLGVITLEDAKKIEQDLTLKYMKEYGIPSVRGGSLTYDGKYIYRFHRFFEEEQWQTITVIILLILTNLLLIIDKYFWS